MFSRAFWRAACERAIKTFCQTAVAVFSAANVASLFDADVGNVAAISATAAALSVLTSIGTSALGDTPSPSLVPQAEAELAEKG